MGAFSYALFQTREQAVFCVVMTYVIALLLAVELVRYAFKLKYSLEKQNQKLRRLPVLLANQKYLGENTLQNVYPNTATKMGPRKWRASPADLA